MTNRHYIGLFAKPSLPRDAAVFDKKLESLVGMGKDVRKIHDSRRIGLMKGYADLVAKEFSVFFHRFDSFPVQCARQLC